jgi:hypothetical protein
MDRVLYVTTLTVLGAECYGKECWSLGAIDRVLFFGPCGVVACLWSITYEEVVVINAVIIVQCGSCGVNDIQYCTMDPVALDGR